ncbi:hypothetical protein ONZ51_g6318 [Trametes cubensis]|uniref:Uncharacterized protein n=1 Tax=Trametes cubensis TaxID=1111947 RepID=A0AAD7X8G4_9APHY|nr:hypothetical protein ONZ51_g6318 [Trametes cubensis]
MHILNWRSLRHLRNDDTRSPQLLAGRIINLYDPPTPRTVGSSLKWQNVLEGYSFFLHEYPPTHPFISLLDELSAICKTHYEQLPVESLIEAAHKGTLESVCVDGIVAVDGLPSLAPPLNTHRAILAAFDKSLPELEKLEDQLLQYTSISTSFTLDLI